MIFQCTEDLVRFVSVQDEQAELRRRIEVVTLADPNAAARLLLNFFSGATLVANDVGCEGVRAEHLESMSSQLAQAASALAATLTAPFTSFATTLAASAMPF
jgi:hypothetical protein